MVVGKPFDVMVERIQGGGGDAAGLAHAAAEQLAGAACLLDELARSDQRGADRGAEPLAETDRHSVEVRRPFARRDAGGDDGVPQTGAVEVHGQAVLARPLTDGLNFFDGIDPAAAAVVGVFQADQTGADAVLIVGADLVFELAQIEDAEVAVEQSKALSTPERIARAGLLISQ